MTHTVTSAETAAAPRAAAKGAWQITVTANPAAIGRRWTEIEARGATTLFQCREWLEALYRRMPSADQDAEAVIVMVDDAGGTPALILPLVRRREKGLRWLGFVDFGVADYNAPLLGPAAPGTPAAMRRLWRAIRRKLPAADIIRFEKMPKLIGDRVNPLTWLKGAGQSVLLQSACAVSAPYEAAREKLMPQRFREKLDSSLKRLNKRAAVRFDLAQTVEEVDVILAALLEQKAKRAQTLGWDSIVDVPEWQAFYREMALNGLNGGTARLLALWVDDEPVAIILGFLHGTRFCDIVASFDAGKWKNHSLGLLVQDLAMGWMAERGVTVYDLTVGTESYKDDFGPVTETMMDYAAAGSLRGWPAATKERAKAWLRARPHLARFAKRAAGRS